MMHIQLSKEMAKIKKYTLFLMSNIRAIYMNYVRLSYLQSNEKLDTAAQK